MKTIADTVLALIAEVAGIDVDRFEPGGTYCPNNTKLSRVGITGHKIHQLKSLLIRDCDVTSTFLDFEEGTRIAGVVAIVKSKKSMSLSDCSGGWPVLKLPSNQ